LGDIIAFEIDYTALLFLNNSIDVDKIFINKEYTDFE